MLIERNTLINGDCMSYMASMPSKCVDFTLTDVPYDGVNRKTNRLRNLNKGKADIATFDLDTFLAEVFRVSKGSICIFCSWQQVSGVSKFFMSKKGTTRQIIWQKSNPSPMNGALIYLSGIEVAVWFKPSGHKTFNAYCKK